MFYWLRYHVDEEYAFLGAIFYLFAPYHLIDMHFRVAIGEMTAMLFLPLSFLTIDFFIKKRSFLWIFLTGVSVALLILSHAAIAIIGFSSITLYALFRVYTEKNTRNLFIFLGLIIGLLYSSYYWIPALVEGKYVHTNLDNWTLVFPQLSELLYSKWRYGFLFQGHYGELSFVLGYAHWIVIFISIYLIFIKKVRSKTMMFFLLLSFILILLTQNVSKPIWENVVILKKMYLPYRLLAVIAFSTSSLTALVIKYVKSKHIYSLLLVIVITSTILNWGNRGNVSSVNDKEIQENLPYITYSEEGAWNAVSKTRPFDNLWQKDIPKSQIEAVSGRIEVLSESIGSTKHTYKISVIDDAIIKENTYFFPGWQLLVDGKEKNIEYEHLEYPGIITFDLESGIHTIELSFNNSPIRSLSLAISFVSLLISGIILIYPNNKR